MFQTAWLLLDVTAFFLKLIKIFIGGRMTPGGGQGNVNGGGYQNGGSAGYQNGVNGVNGMAQIQMLSQQATKYNSCHCISLCVS